MTGADNSVSALEGVSSAFIAICTVAVGLRYLVRVRRGDDYRVDDWSMLASLPFVVAYCGCVIALVRIGWEGWGAQPFPQNEFVAKFQQAGKIVIASDVCLLLALALTKASALLFYRRIFCATGCSSNRGLEFAIYATLAVLPLWVITFCFLAGFQCGTHLLDAFKKEVNARYCRLGTVFAYGHFTSDLILDVWVICLPIPSIVRLHARASRKLLIAGLFLIASVGLIASGLRLSNFLGGFIFHTVQFPKEETEDLSSTIFFYNVLELGMSVVSINLPVLWGLFTKAVPEHMVRTATSTVSLDSNAPQEDGSGLSSIKMANVASSAMDGKSTGIVQAA